MKQRVSPVLGLLLVGAVTQLGSVQAAGAGESSGYFPAVSGSAVLTVSGSGYRHREVYSDGDYPSLSGLDESGYLLPDGEYRYQLRSVPVGGVSTSRQQELMTGKPAGRANAKPRRASVLSGKFEIRDGELFVR